MEAPPTFLCFMGLLVLVSTAGQVDEAGECVASSPECPDNEAMKLATCVSAAQDVNTTVLGSCCAQVKRIGQNPSCLRAVMLPNTAKASRIKPEIAIAIP